MVTINHEYYVSYEVAKLLEKVGFSWEIGIYYTYNNDDGKFILSHAYNNTVTNWNAKEFFMRGIDGSIFVNNGTYLDSITEDYISTTFISAPTLDVAQRWLREVKNVAVEIKSKRWVNRYQDGRYTVSYIYELWPIDTSIVPSREDKFTCYTINCACDIEFQTYEEAQEAGIKKALEIILENEQ